MKLGENRRNEMEIISVSNEHKRKDSSLEPGLTEEQSDESILQCYITLLIKSL